MSAKKTKVKNDLAMRLEARAHRHTFVLWPKLWKAWNAPKVLKWEGELFVPASKASIPNKPGVYAFVIMPGVPPGVPNAALMYIGKTDRPLRERFAEYLREKDDPSGRPAINTMLQMYYGYLYFYCACVDTKTRPKKVEDYLIEKLLPPMNRQYPASISRIIGAFS